MKPAAAIGMRLAQPAAVSTPATPQNLSQAKALCVAHTCPRCQSSHHVNVEQILVGHQVVTRCHCRVCDYSWHPVITQAGPPAS
jgi:transposase-like protein